MSHFTDNDYMKKLAKKIQADFDAQFRAAITVSFSISPSSDDSNYEYQEPEQDEQGTLYGYKYLSWDGEAFYSPSWYAKWNNGRLTSDKRPGEGHMHGIHFTKRQNHPALGEYSVEQFRTGRIRVIVKCALSGTVVETAQGFRAEQAQIIGVLVDGNWKSYSDYQGCARPHPRPNPYYKKTERPTRWITLDWDGAYTSDDSNP